MQAGAGQPAHFRDEDFAEVSQLATADEVISAADVLFCVQPPSAEAIDKMKPGAVLIGCCSRGAAPSGHSSWHRRTLPPSRSSSCRASPRAEHGRASSQGAVAGYECALIAADHSPKFFPMLTYAAGTIRPAKVLVIGAGVAGLQAIATARRIGAMVEA